MLYYSVRSSDPMPGLTDNSVILDWLRVNDTELATVDRLLKSAMHWAEGVTGQPLFERVYTVQLSAYHGGYLPGIQPRNVKVDYTGTDGLPGTWGPFATNVYTDPFFVSAEGRLSFLSSLTRPLFGSYSSLTYKAGYVPEETPDDIINALLLAVAYDYDHRANPVSERPTAAERLLQRYKIYTV